MTFMSDEGQRKLSPEELRNKLKDTALSGEQKLLGDIITESEMLAYKEAIEIEAVRAEQSAAEPTKEKKKFRPFWAVALATLAIFALIIGVAVSPSFDFAKEAIAGNQGEGYEVQSNDYDVMGEGESDSGANMEMQTASIDDWEGVADIKAFFPELLVPEYMPEGAEFVVLNVSKWEENAHLNYKVEYVFQGLNDAPINIMQKKSFEKFSKKDLKKGSGFKEVMTAAGGGTYRYYEENDSSIVVAVIGNKRISIIGKLTENEAIKILQSME